jgi:hypothetical protein
MAMRVAGKLNISAGERLSFEGCRVEALFAHTSSSGLGAPSALSDAAGNFALVLHDRQEIAGDTVRFVALSPMGRVIGEAEITTADLGDAITIDVEHLANAPPAPETPTATPERTAVDAMFRADTAFRAALTDNLKPLRAEAAAINKRIDTAFERFHATPLSAEERAARRYVEPGTDPGEVLERVVSDSVGALRSAGTERTMTLRNGAELKSLMTPAPGDGDPAIGRLDLAAFLRFLGGKGGGSLVADAASTRCQTELQAESIVAALEGAPAVENGGVSVSTKGDSPGAQEADELVQGSVGLQMRSATAPETRLEYGSMPGIPNTADKDAVQSRILQTFELRPGASDVTSYHDFHTLQIAFQHVWTRLFDGELESLGRGLYREYVKLKDFSGSTDADLRVSTVDDLRRLMAEVKKLSQIVEDDIPGDLRGDGGTATRNGTKGSAELSDGAKFGIGVATGGLSWLLDWALEAFSQTGKKPIIKWAEFPGPWPPRQDKIEVSFATAVVPAGHVEIVLKTDYGSHIKIIEFEPWDVVGNQFVHGPQISNAGHVGSVTLALRTSQIAAGVLEFASEESTGLNLGRYVLGNLPEKLKDGTRVTFYWKDN